MTAKRHFRRELRLVSIGALAIVFCLSLAAHTVSAQSATTTATSSDTGLSLIAAAAAITGSCMAAGYAVAKAASAAAAAIVERPGAFGPMLILAGLGEGIAIYGLLVAFQILSKIP